MDMMRSDTDICLGLGPHSALGLGVYSTLGAGIIVGVPALGIMFIPDIRRVDVGICLVLSKKCTQSRRF